MTGKEKEIITNTPTEEDLNDGDGNGNGDALALTNNYSTTTEELGIEIVLDLKNFMILGLFLFFIFPLLPLLLATIFGGLFVLFEPDTTFRQGFLYVVSNLLGMANPLTDYSPTGVTAGVIIDVYVALTALICFGIMLNIVNLFEVPMAINRFIERFVKNAFLLSLIALGILIPLWNVALCCVFGAILALAENWAISDGILYVITNILGLGTPLTDVEPDTVGGALLDIVISSTALGFIAIFADYVTVLNPSRTIRRRFRRILGKLGVIDPETTASRHPLAERYPSFATNKVGGQASQSRDDGDLSSEMDPNLPRPPSFDQN